MESTIDSFTFEETILDELYDLFANGEGESSPGSVDASLLLLPVKLMKGRDYYYDDEKFMLSTQQQQSISQGSSPTTNDRTMSKTTNGEGESSPENDASLLLLPGKLMKDYDDEKFMISTTQQQHLQQQFVGIKTTGKNFSSTSSTNITSTITGGDLPYITNQKLGLIPDFEWNNKSKTSRSLRIQAKIQAEALPCTTLKQNKLQPPTRNKQRKNKQGAQLGPPIEEDDSVEEVREATNNKLLAIIKKDQRAAKARIRSFNEYIEKRKHIDALEQIVSSSLRPSTKSKYYLTKRLTKLQIMAAAVSLLKTRCNERKMLKEKKAALKYELDVLEKQHQNWLVSRERSTTAPINYKKCLLQSKKLYPGHV